jgi:hypothetical protein
MYMIQGADLKENALYLGGLDRRFVLASIGAMMMPVGPVMALEQLTQTYRSSSQGFAFSYPESFVIAFDRTSKNIEDGAVVSVGDFKRFITVTVFASHMPVEGNDFLDVETGYDICIRPIVESDTTMGFRVIREEMKESSGVFDFEYDHSICRGEQIESSGGILRCIVRAIRVPIFLYVYFIHVYVFMQGNFGQDIPVQRKHVIGRAFFPVNASGNKGEVLLTMMASMNADDTSGVAENTKTLTSIVESFIPL